MSKIRKLLSLPASDVRLLGEATVAVVAIRTALWLLEFGRLRAALDRLSAMGSAGASSAGSPSVDRIAWAVKTASRYVPRATCLTQALAARLMLERRATPTVLRIGVARSAERSVEAHAWVECGGRIVIGEAEPGRYLPLDRS